MKQEPLMRREPVYRLNVGDNSQSLLTLIEAFEDGLIKLAPFQRESGAWAKDKQATWALTIANNVPMWGTFCLYRLKYGSQGHGEFYLADGWQRLSTTRTLLESPISFGLDIYPDELKKQLSFCPVTVQYTELNSHDEALILFQRVNQGTTLHPTEYNKGYITCLRDGADFYKNINTIVSHCDVRLCAKETQRIRSLRLQRGSLALFFQYLTKSKSASFWGYASPSLKLSEKSFEQQLADLITEMTSSDLDKIIKQFEKYLDEHTALIETFAKEVLQNNALTSTLFRSLLHFAIYKRNVGLSSAIHHDLVKLTIKHFLVNRGGVVYYDKKGEQATANFRLHDLTAIFVVADIENVEINPNSRRKPKYKLRRGYEHSHLEPFVTHGDGETIAEAAPLNRVRGAKPIE